MDNLNEHPQIAELIDTLDKNGIHTFQTSFRIFSSYFSSGSKYIRCGYINGILHIRHTGF